MQNNGAISLLLQFACYFESIHSNFVICTHKIKTADNYCLSSVSDTKTRDNIATRYSTPSSKKDTLESVYYITGHIIPLGGGGGVRWLQRRPTVWASSLTSYLTHEPAGRYLALSSLASNYFK